MRGPKRVVPKLKSKLTHCGDSLTKAHADGGLELDCSTASLTIAGLMVVGVLLMTKTDRLQANERVAC